MQSAVLVSTFALMVAACFATACSSSAPQALGGVCSELYGQGLKNDKSALSGFRFNGLHRGLFLVLGADPAGRCAVGSDTRHGLRPPPHQRVTTPRLIPTDTRL